MMAYLLFADEKTTTTATMEWNDFLFILLGRKLLNVHHHHRL
jgi:hypothetical protein